MSLKKTGQLSAGTTAVCFVTAGVVSYGFFNGFDFLREAFGAAATVAFVIVFLAALAAAVGFGSIWVDHKVSERRSIKAKRAKEIAAQRRRDALPILCKERPSDRLADPCIEPLFHVGVHQDRHGNQWWSSVYFGETA